ncbi:MATE family efflux transporter [uncultured Intestinimonas sp.]|uniref:MATE family efflux transporter n=1 Tax=uncultured Intestinimonas sp. TaxID=1689265 RepID=UPI0025DC4663|nr:MATE family efflux transporter [uncultured Intestinimonas sp.]
MAAQAQATLRTPERAPLFSADALRRLIIPLVVEQFLAMTIGMADTIMVTSVGEHAVSGVSLVDNISTLLINVFSALATGGAVVAAQYLGSRDEQNACSAAKQLFYAIGALSAATMAVCLLFREPILRLVFGRLDDNVMEAAMTYFLLTAISYPLLAIYNAGAALFRAMGNSKVSMLASLLMNVVNIGLNAILIYGAGIGVAGAGFGTLFSRLAGAVLMTWLICQSGHRIHIDHLLHFEFRGQLVKKILRIGVPNGLENGMFQIGKLLVLGLVTPLGTSATAANAIANSVAGVVNVPGNAISLSLITVVGQCMGAGDSKQAVRYTRKLMIIVYLAMGSLSVLLFFCAAPVVGLFGLTPGAAVMAIQVLRWCAVFDLIFWPMSFTLPNALRASGDAKFTMIVSMCSMWIFRIGFSYLLVPQIGLLGVWVAMFIDWIVRAVVFLIRFLSGRWKTKTVI